MQQRKTPAFIHNTLHNRHAQEDRAEQALLAPWMTPPGWEMQFKDSGYQRVREGTACGLREGEDEEGFLSCVLQLSSPPKHREMELRLEVTGVLLSLVYRAYVGRYGTNTAKNQVTRSRRPRTLPCAAWTLLGRWQKPREIFMNQKQKSWVRFENPFSKQC